MISPAPDCLAGVCDVETSLNGCQPKDEFKVHVTRIVDNLEYVLGELKTVVVDMRKMADEIDLVTSRVDRYYGNCAADDRLHLHGNANKDGVEAKSCDMRTRSRIDKSLVSPPSRTRTRTGTRTVNDELHVIPDLCGLLQSQRRQGNHFRCSNSRETAPKSREIITEASRREIQPEVGGAVGPEAATTLEEQEDRVRGGDVLRVDGLFPRSVRSDDDVDRQSIACVCLCDTSSSSQDTGYCGLYEKELDERLELDASGLCLLTPEGQHPFSLYWNAASGRGSIESVRRDDAVTDELLLRNYSPEVDGDNYNDGDGDKSVSDDDDDGDDDYDKALNCEKTFPSRIMISKMRNCRWRAIIEP